jgi:hypothetical protein
MADNTTLNAGSGGKDLATASLTFSGDTAEFQICGVTILTGSEGSWTQTLVVGGAGAVTGGVQRVTLASDDPAVALLGTMDADTGAIKTAVEGTLTVGSHAVTNAGTFVVQEDGAALTALQLIDDAVYADDADWSDGTSKHILTGGLYQSSPQSITDGDVGPFQVTANGYLIVSVNGTVAVSGTVTANLGTIAGVATETTLSTLSGNVTACDTGAVVISSGTITAVTDITNTVTVDGTITANLGTIAGVATESTLSTLSGNVTACNTGAVVISSGTVTTVSTVTAVTDITNTVTVDNAGTFVVQDNPQTSGGLSMSKLISAASVNATNVKNAAGHLYSVQVFNTNAAARYFKLYNDSGAPTVGTDTPVKVMTIPGNTAGAGLVINWDKGLAFGTGIAFGLTTGAADNDTGAVAAAEIVVNLDYK